MPKIYNVLPLWNASHSDRRHWPNIAILGRSDIVAIQDVRDFRTLFGCRESILIIFNNGSDPGIWCLTMRRKRIWMCNGLAPLPKERQVNLVVSGSTETRTGSIFPLCMRLKTILRRSSARVSCSANFFWGRPATVFRMPSAQQAAAQGITFLTATGDQGSAACDISTRNSADACDSRPHGKGLATSPYGIAVGGTDFLNYGVNYTASSLRRPVPTGIPSNDTNQASAKGYIPESTWNSTCTNNIFVVFNYGKTPEASCNNSQGG